MGRAQKLKQQRKEEQAKRREEEKKERYRKAAIVIASILVIGVTVFLILLVNSMKKEKSENPKPVITQELVLETSKGEIVIGLHGKDAPQTVGHITGLVGQGFYDNLRWYRVENFVVQTGSHVQSLMAFSEGTEPDQAQFDTAMQMDQGAGTVVDEVGQPNVRGAVAMAKRSDPQSNPQNPSYVPDSASTDFYILKQDAPGLNEDFTVFGEVVSGMDVVDSLETTDVLISAQVRAK